MCKSLLGPCFGLWMAAGMVDCWKATGEEKYLESAKKNFGYMKSLIADGRMQTSMEQTEDPDEFWRPVSSENVIALYAFAHAWKVYPEPAWKEACETILPFVLGLVDKKTGAVRNCDESCLGCVRKQRSQSVRFRQYGRVCAACVFGTLRGIRKPGNAAVCRTIGRLGGSGSVRGGKSQMGRLLARCVLSLDRKMGGALQSEKFGVG